MQTDFDLIILGGGCAGLSLATRLAELGRESPTTLIIEARTHYTLDRTWCFWDDGATRLRPLIQHRWQKMTVRAAGRAVTVDCGAKPYCLLPADAFYSAAAAAIGFNGRLDLSLGMRPHVEPRKVGNKWVVEAKPSIFTAKMVVDTRPVQKPKSGNAILWQSFYGREIECDAAVFDPARAELMDFADGHDRDIRFTYVLPLSPTRALIETTVFGPDPHSPLALAKELDVAIKRYTGSAGYYVRRREDGILPMGIASAAANTDPTYVRAGLGNGGARPSTGYAFQRIQRWADCCAQNLQLRSLPLGHAPDPVLLRAMDHLFLSVLRARSAEAPAMFLALFEKVDPARMIRFLSDGGSIVDYAIVAAALPVLPFLAEIPNAFSRTLKLRAAS